MLILPSPLLRILLVLFAVPTLLLLVSNGPAVAQKKQGGKKDDKIKIESKPKDERIYPVVEPLVLIKGHEDRVNSVLFTPNGKTLVSVSRDKTVRLWDAATGKELRKIKDVSTGDTTLSLSPNGNKLATTSGKWNKDKKQWIGEINLYEASNGKHTSTIVGHMESIDALAFHPDGNALASASADGTAQVWNVATGKQVHILKGHAGPVATVVYSNHGKLIATGGDDKTVKVWDAATGQEIKTLDGPKRAVTSVAFNKDGKLLAAGSQDGTVTIWNTSDFKQVRVLNADDGVYALAFSPDGAKLATGGWERVVKIWDLTTGKEIGGLAGHTEAVSSVVFNPTGDRVASASLDRTVRVWDVTAAKQKVDPPKKKAPR